MKQRKQLIIGIGLLIVAAIAVIGIIDMAMAAEQVLDTKIDSMVLKTDRNGKPFVRFIVSEDRELQGVKYSVGVPVMAFGALVEKAKAYSNGGPLKAIVRLRIGPNGNESYTVIKFIE